MQHEYLNHNVFTKKTTLKGGFKYLSYEYKLLSRIINNHII